MTMLLISSPHSPTRSVPRPQLFNSIENYRRNFFWDNWYLGVAKYMFYHSLYQEGHPPNHSSMYLFIYLHVYRSTQKSRHPPICLSMYLPADLLNVYTHVTISHLSFYLPINLYVCQCIFIYLSIYQSTYLHSPILLFTYLCIYLLVYLLLILYRL